MNRVMTRLFASDDETAALSRHPCEGRDPEQRWSGKNLPSICAALKLPAGWRRPLIADMATISLTKQIRARIVKL